MLVSCTTDDRSSDRPTPTSATTSSFATATLASSAVSTTPVAGASSAVAPSPSVDSGTKGMAPTVSSTHIETRDPQPNELRMMRLLEQAGASEIGIAQFGFDDAQMVATWNDTEMYVIAYPLKTKTAVELVEKTTIGGHGAWTGRAAGFGSGIYFECADFSYQLYINDGVERSATPTELDTLVRFAETLMPLAACS
jgi:hypothetical protein